MEYGADVYSIPDCIYQVGKDINQDLAEEKEKIESIIVFTV